MIEVDNISASGVLLKYDESTEIRIQEGDFCVLDIIINDDFNLNAEAQVTRLSGDSVGMRFSKIPEAKQAFLWELLGEHVDTIESNTIASI